MERIKLVQGQLAIMLALYLVFGVVYIDAYYDGFGISYQFLDLNYNHVLYRAFTIAYSSFSFGVLSLFLLLALLLQHFPQAKIFQRHRSILEYLTFATFLLCFVAGCFLARTHGFNNAVEDAYLDTTSLQQLATFYSADAAKQAYVNKHVDDDRGALILSAVRNELIFFRPPTMRAKAPRFPIHRVRLSSNDYFSSKTPLFR